MGGRKRCILALDGGGTRGIVEIAFLTEIERQLQNLEPTRTNVRLCQYFDLVGGTSTGAIIAAALSIGWTAADIRELYLELAPRIFRRKWWRISGIQSRFDEKPLLEILRRELGGISLDDEKIRTHLGIVTKRVDTGSVWIVSNIPGQPYWNDPADQSYIGNRHYKLAELVRASTAAPYYFRPQEIEILGKGHVGIFADGGVTPYNDPSLALLMLATLGSFGLSWPVGKDNMLLLSIGTGTFRDPILRHTLKRKPAAGFAVETLIGLMSDCQIANQALLQWMGYSPAPWTINSEIGTLAEDNLATQPVLTYQRYDIKLEQRWLRDTLGIQVSDSEMVQLRRLDNPAAMGALEEYAKAAARQQVNLGAMMSFFRQPEA